LQMNIPSNFEAQGNRGRAVMPKKANSRGHGGQNIWPGGVEQEEFRPYLMNENLRGLVDRKEDVKKYKGMVDLLEKWGGSINFAVFTSSRVREGRPRKERETEWVRGV